MVQGPVDLPREAGSLEERERDGFPWGWYSGIAGKSHMQRGGSGAGFKAREIFPP
jgi:hypothetical protein